VGTVAPKDGAKDAKASQKDNSQDSKDASGDKSAVDTGSQQDANTAQNVSQPSAKPSARTEKSNNEKQEVLAETDEETPDESQIAATTLQLLSLQNVPPQPPVQPAVQAPVTGPSTGSSDDLTVGATTPAAPIPPSADLQPSASAANASGAPKPVVAQDDQQDDEPVAAANAPAQAPQSQAPQPDIQPAQPGKTIAKPQAMAAKPASDPAPQPAGDDTVSQEEIAPADAPKSNAAPKPATGKGDTVKTASPKADFGKGRFAQDAKTDPNKGDADKIAQLAPAALPAEADEINEPPKPAPQPVQALSNNPLINPNTPAGNVPANPIAVAHVTQHIQVTATPAPNLPALAVEIAAKSQSGAKQFDIRLDPPELGRVEVRLSIDATGKASAHLSADQPQTLNLLQKDASVLTRALREAGLDVSQDGLNFSLRQQSDNNQSAGNGNRRSRSFSLSATSAIDATAMTAAYRGPANGRLDIRV
jgi:flagellar hook-length control protein FliK